jgi:hypothetical protein
LIPSIDTLSDLFYGEVFFLADYDGGFDQKNVGVGLAVVHKLGDVFNKILVVKGFEYFMKLNPSFGLRYINFVKEPEHVFESRPIRA